MGCFNFFIAFLCIHLVSAVHVKIALPTAAVKQNTASEACRDYASVNKSNLTFPSQYRNPWARDVVNVYRSQAVTNGINIFYGMTVPGLGGTTIKQVIDHIFSQGCLCFPFGGLVRDQFLGATPKDLDMEVSCSIDSFLQICRGMWGDQCTSNSAGTIAHIGTKSGDQENIDAANWNDTFFSDTFVSLEFTTNSIAYDSNNNSNIVVDITGTGVVDTCNKKIRIPSPTNEWTNWYNNRANKGYRYWKLRNKGYTPYDNATFNFIKASVESSIRSNKQGFLQFYCTSLLGGTFTPPNTCTASNCETAMTAQSSYDDLFAQDLGDFWTTEVQPELSEFFQSCSSSPNAGSMNRVSWVVVSMSLVLIAISILSLM